MVGLAEVFMDLKLDMVELALSFKELDRVMNSLLSWEDRHAMRMGIRRNPPPMQRLSEEALLEANTLESDATQLPLGLMG